MATTTSVTPTVAVIAAAATVTPTIAVVTATVIAVAVIAVAVIAVAVIAVAVIAVAARAEGVGTRIVVGDFSTGGVVGCTWLRRNDSRKDRNREEPHTCQTQDSYKRHG
ncbi:hypothetical protein [Rhodococcus sp. KBS0724]|uniref:hypothetical protein n=1 Tax=Rhodococcus sp. KBS0724 TaxID=1179674 RepID=UPI00163DA2CD|nr:hypothetical protein [Rhodococcus sp. KBS0724]